MKSVVLAAFAIRARNSGPLKALKIRKSSSIMLNSLMLLQFVSLAISFGKMLVNSLDKLNLVIFRKSVPLVKALRWKSTVATLVLSYSLGERLTLPLLEMCPPLFRSSH